MLAICIATLSPASWLAVEAPPPSVLLLLLLLSLSPLPLAHIFWYCAADAARVRLCVPAQGLLSQVLSLLSLGLVESRDL